MGDRQNSSVIGVIAQEAAGKFGEIGVIELHPDGSAEIIDSDRFVQATIRDTKVVEGAKRRPGKVTKLWVIAFGLKLTHHRDGNQDLVLCKTRKRSWVGEKNAGIKEIDLSSHFSNHVNNLKLARLRGSATRGRQKLHSRIK